MVLSERATNQEMLCYERLMRLIGSSTTVAEVQHSPLHHVLLLLMQVCRYTSSQPLTGALAPSMRVSEKVCTVCNLYGSE